MRVIQITPGITEEASGPSYSVVRLCESLIDAGTDLTLATIDWSPLTSLPRFARAFPLGRGPKRLGRAPEMYRWLLHESRVGNADVMHSHGMWQMNAVYPGWVTAKHNATGFVVSPRGALSRWALSHGSRLKGVFWRFLQRPALANADCFHATSKLEHDDIRELGFEQPIAIIPNGIDIPPMAKCQSLGVRSLLYLGRIHPKKGIDLLLNAWAAVMNRFSDWELVVVGTDAGYSNKGGYLYDMKTLAASLRLTRMRFVEPLYGGAKLTAYRDADLFVLPTLSENFGVSVAEALASGTPAIVTKGAPWEGLRTQEAGWWVDTKLDALIASLEEAMAKSRDELARLGRNGREWMIRDFSWPDIGKRMHLTYRWLNEGDAIPPWVSLN